MIQIWRMCRVALLWCEAKPRTFHPRLVPMNTQSGILCDPASLVLYGRCQASSRPHARSRKGESRRTWSEPFFLEVFGGVLGLGRIAAAHMSANQAQAQVDPGVSGFHAIFTHVLVSVSELDLVKVAAFVWHRFLLDEKPQF